MTTTQRIKGQCSRLRLYHLPKVFERHCVEAREKELTHSEFLCSLLEAEISEREQKDLLKRLRAANLPPRHDLDDFDFNHSHSLSESRMKELRELTWMEQAYNIILMGPSGTGKTFIASGLVHEAVKAGFRASIMTMEDLVTTIRLKDLHHDVPDEEGRGKRLFQSRKHHAREGVDHSDHQQGAHGMGAETR